ncbi:MAG: methyltransferase domain-containing protein [Verrucomicrobiota bacterium JB023]|nr:methyltransferase domain-containing protein [Verrucomicrobiota bacterium JB023]
MSVSSENNERLTCEFGFVDNQGKSRHAKVLDLREGGFTFEVLEPEGSLQTGDQLAETVLTLNGRLAYEGTVEVSGVARVGLTSYCEAKLAGDWNENVGNLPSTGLQAEENLRRHLDRWAESHNVRPFFRDVVVDLEVYLSGLENWCQEVEQSLLAEGDSASAKERELLTSVAPQVSAEINAHFADYERVAKQLADGERAVHRGYLMKSLHRYILQSPFSYRCFSKPLGYAGDYGMVNIMMEDPFSGETLLAKLLNYAFLSTGPVVAHQNRISYLTNMLSEEVAKRAAEGKRTRILNLGCGPAQEVRYFIEESDLVEMCDFELLDFSEETLKFTQSEIEKSCEKSGSDVNVRFIKESIQGFLKKATKGDGFSTKSYDVVYCAGLFDYLQQRFCQKLVAGFCELAKDEGLVVVTNVSTRNTIPYVMEDFLEWSIIHRDVEEMLNLFTNENSSYSKELKSDSTEINFFLELRKAATRGDVDKNQRLAQPVRRGSGVSQEVRGRGSRREGSELSHS